MIYQFSGPTLSRKAQPEMRSYAHIMTAIWRKDVEFRALLAADQRMYLLLTTQGDISAAGTLPLVISRWADLAPDTTEDDIRTSLARLSAGGFVVIDYTTQELLVRSFVRWDKGYGNAKRRPVILDAAASTTSSILRSALATEFERLGLPTAGLDIDPAVARDRAVPEPAEAEGQESLFPQVDRPSGGLSRFDRVVVTTDVSPPHPSSLNPQHPPATRAAAQTATPGGATEPTVNQRAQQLARIYTDVVKLSNFPAVMTIAKKALTSGDYDDQQIGAALARLAEDRRGVSTESLRIELEGLPNPRSQLAQRPSTTDARVAQAEALRDQLVGSSWGDLL